jgi:hypothetical protein
VSDGVPSNIARLSRMRGLEPLDCQVLLSTDDLIVASELSNSLDLDGLCLVPTKTVMSFDRDFERVQFYNAAVGFVELAGNTSHLLKVLEGRLYVDLNTLAKLGVTVSVYLGFDDPDVCFVGVISSLTLENIELLQVSSMGEELEVPMIIPLHKITKVEVGTRYLLAVGRAKQNLKRGNKGDGSL